MSSDSHDALDNDVDDDENENDEAQQLSMAKASDRSAGAAEQRHAQVCTVA